MKKSVLKIVAFLLIFALSAGYVINIYAFPTSFSTRCVAGFYKEEKNTIDGVFLGTSVVSCGWNAPVAFKEHGIAVYAMGSSIQPFGIYPEYLEFIRKTQDIKYAFIDVHGLRRQARLESLVPAKARIPYTDLKYGKSRTMMRKSVYDYVERAYDFYGVPDERYEYFDTSKTSYVFEFIDFHNRWIDGLEKADYVTVANPYKSAHDRKRTFYINSNASHIDTWEYGPYVIDEFQKNEIQRIIDYAEKTNLEVVFINFPTFTASWEEGELHGIMEYIESIGQRTLDLQSLDILEDMNVSYSLDYADRTHLNSKGSAKATMYLSEYIKENLYYEDHREDERYESWHKCFEKYSKYFKNGWEDRGDDYTLEGIIASVRK